MLKGHCGVWQIKMCSVRQQPGDPKEWMVQIKSTGCHWKFLACSEAGLFVLSRPLIGGQSVLLKVHQFKYYSHSKTLPSWHIKLTKEAWQIRQLTILNPMDTKDIWALAENECIQGFYSCNVWMFIARIWWLCCGFEDKNDLVWNNYTLKC